MIWKVPNRGDVRYNKQLALIPTRVKDNQDKSYMVWFGVYMAYQTYVNNEWRTDYKISMDAYNERAKYKQLFTDKTGVKYNVDTVQDLLNELDYNSKI